MLDAFGVSPNQQSIGNKENSMHIRNKRQLIYYAYFLSMGATRNQAYKESIYYGN